MAIPTYMSKKILTHYSNNYNPEKIRFQLESNSFVAETRGYPSDIRKINPITRSINFFRETEKDPTTIQARVFIFDSNNYQESFTVPGNQITVEMMSSSEKAKQKSNVLLSDIGINQQEEIIHSIEPLGHRRIEIINNNRGISLNIFDS